MNNQRHGAVIVFKPGTTKEEAGKALRKIQDVLDMDYYVNPDPANLVNEFDSEWGGPVWYIP